MPLLKVLIPFAIGIAVADRVALPAWFVAAVLLVGGAAALLTHRSRWLVLLLAAAGYGATLLRPAPAAPPVGRRTVFEIRLTEAPDMRGNAEGVVTAWRDPAAERWHATRVRLRLHTNPQEGLRLEAGDRLLCHTVLRPFTGGSESFRRLMRRRGFVGSCYLTERSLVEHLPALRRGLHRHASERLEERLGTPRDSLRRDAAAVVRAMAVGDRRGLHPALRDAYARSGMAHLLAVSGLHTGIVYLLVAALFAWLPLRHGGHRLRNLLVIAGLWLYVAAAGAAPGAVRAAVMCSILQLGLATSSPYRAMNAWAAAALLMLLWRPAWLYDISFRLSFVAVAAILLWGVPLARRLRTGRWYADLVTQPLAIGLAASLATAPLVSHAFGIVPLAGILLNPVVVLSGALVTGGGVLLLLLPPLQGVLRPATMQVAAWQNRLAERVAACDAGVLETGLSAEAVALLYLGFVAATLAAWSFERKKSVHLPA